MIRVGKRFRYYLMMVAIMIAFVFQSVTTSGSVDDLGSNIKIKKTKKALRKKGASKASNDASSIFTGIDLVDENAKVLWGLFTGQKPTDAEKVSLFVGNPSSNEFERRRQLESARNAYENLSHRLRNGYITVSIRKRLGTYDFEKKVFPINPVNDFLRGGYQTTSWDGGSNFLYFLNREMYLAEGRTAVSIYSDNNSNYNKYYGPLKGFKFWYPIPADSRQISVPENQAEIYSTTLSRAPGYSRDLFLTLSLKPMVAFIDDNYQNIVFDLVGAKFETCIMVPDEGNPGSALYRPANPLIRKLSITETEKSVDISDCFSGMKSVPALMRLDGGNTAAMQMTPENDTVRPSSEVPQNRINSTLQYADEIKYSRYQIGSKPLSWANSLPNTEVILDRTGSNADDSNVAYFVFSGYADGHGNVGLIEKGRRVAWGYCAGKSIFYPDYLALLSDDDLEKTLSPEPPETLHRLILVVPSENYFGWYYRNIVIPSYDKSSAFKKLCLEFMEKVSSKLQLSQKGGTFETPLDYVNALVAANSPSN